MSSLRRTIGDSSIPSPISGINRDVWMATAAKMCEAAVKMTPACVRRGETIPNHSVAHVYLDTAKTCEELDALYRPIALTGICTGRF